MFFVSGCSLLKNNNLNDGENNNEKTNNIIVSENFTALDILGAKIKFKKTNPTNFWDSKDSFGAMEIDTVYIFSKNGGELENYEEVDTAMILFQTNQLTPTNENDVKTKLNRWYQITDPAIIKLSNNLFMYKILGESSSTYYESYYTEYMGKFDGSSESKVYYEIILKIPKNILSNEEQQMAKDEFHTIIDTIEFE